METADLSSLEHDGDHRVRRRLADLYASHHGWLRRWLRHRLGNDGDAADLTHDTFVRLLIRGQVPACAQSRAHLTQIARGLAIDLHRRRVIESAYLDALARLPEAHYPAPETRALAIESLCLLDAALGRLPARMREVFLLSQLEGLTYSAIAARQGIAVATVRKYMLRAAQACHAALAEPAAGAAQPAAANS